MKSVFKYRTCNSEFHLNCLSKREIYFSSFKENRMDDPEEGKFLVNFENVDRNLLMSRLLEHQPNATVEFLSERISYFMHPKNKEDLLLNYENINERFLELSGIFCVSRTKDNLNNWGKFAANENGFVVEYDLEFFKNYHIQKVIYTDERPIIHFNELMGISENPKSFGREGNNYLKLKYLYKPLKYKDEDEIRIIVVSENTLNRKVQVEEKSILSVNIGRKVNEFMKQKILISCEQGEISRSKIKFH